MSSETQKSFNTEYEAGKAAFERGLYRQSVQHLETAIALASPNSRQGGEAQIWLVTAYEAAELRTEAIDLCKSLNRHPDRDTRQQSQHLLYIMEAPQLNRRPEWLTEIPDLTALGDSETKFRGNSAPRPASSPQPAKAEPVDLSQVNTQDNRFIWFALGAIALILGSLVWFW